MYQLINKFIYLDIISRKMNMEVEKLQFKHGYLNFYLDWLYLIHMNKTQSLT